MNEKTSILSTVSIYHAFNDGAISVIPLMFPIFKTIFNLSYTQVGIITGGGLLISIIAQLIIGRLSDGKNCRTMLSTGVLLISFSMYLLTRSIGFLTIVMFMFMLRFSASFFHPIGTGWISRIFKKDRLDWAMGVQSGFADVGAFIAVSTTLLVSELINWEFTLYIWSISGSIILLIGIFLTRNIDEKYLIVEKTKQKQTIKESLSEVLVFLKNIKILIPAMIISGATWGVTITYMPLLLAERTSLSLSYIGLIVSIWIGVGSLTCFLYGRITSKIGRKNVILFSYLTVGVMGVLLVFFSNIYIILGIMLLLGVSTFLTYPAIASFISEITHESAEGKTFGTVFTFQLGGGTIFLFFGGVFSDMFGIWTPFAMLGMFSLFIAGLIVVNIKKPIVKPI